jgi:hypothetical protein
MSPYVPGPVVGGCWLATGGAPRAKASDTATPETTCSVRPIFVARRAFMIVRRAFIATAPRD